MTSGILSDKSAVTRFGDYIQWDDKEDAVKTMNSFIKEYDFSYAIFWVQMDRATTRMENRNLQSLFLFKPQIRKKANLLFVPFYKEQRRYLYDCHNLCDGRER